MPSTQPPPAGFPFPVVDALPHLRRRGPLALWRAAWTRRHTVAALVLLPVLGLFFRSALPGGGDLSTTGVALLALLSAGSALLLATFVPPPKGADTVATDSPCARLTWAFPLLAAAALDAGGSSVESGVAALFVLGLGISQRLVGSVLCPPR